MFYAYNYSCDLLPKHLFSSRGLIVALLLHVFDDSFARQTYFTVNLCDHIHALFTYMLYADNTYTRTKRAKQKSLLSYLSVYEYVVGLCITMDTENLKLMKALSLREKKSKNDDNAITVRDDAFVVTHVVREYATKLSKILEFALNDEEDDKVKQPIK